VQTQQSSVLDSESDNDSGRDDDKDDKDNEGSDADADPVPPVATEGGEEAKEADSKQTDEDDYRRPQVQFARLSLCLLPYLFVCLFVCLVVHEHHSHPSPFFCLFPIVFLFVATVGDTQNLEELMFEQELNSLLQDSLKEARSSVTHIHSSLPILPPPSFLGPAPQQAHADNSQQMDEDDEGAITTMPFRLLVRKGQKATTKQMRVPMDSSLAQFNQRKAEEDRTKQVCCCYFFYFFQDVVCLTVLAIFFFLFCAKHRT
jgi:hypothetical protein